MHGEANQPVDDNFDPFTQWLQPTGGLDVDTELYKMLNALPDDIMNQIDNNEYDISGMLDTQMELLGSDLLDIGLDLDTGWEDVFDDFNKVGEEEKQEKVLEQVVEEEATKMEVVVEEKQAGEAPKEE